MRTTKLKEIVQRSPLYSLVGPLKHRREYRAWQRNGGSGAAPHLLKQETLAEYKSRFGCQVLVETGTYLGEMVAAMSEVFPQIISVELDPVLAARARRRFARHEHVQIIQGDSATVVPRILADLRMPALFWLDAHYSSGITAGCDQGPPVQAEVLSILEHSIRQHVILIDDARAFGTTAGYPHVSVLEERVAAADRDLICSVAHDIIRIHPR